MTGVDLGGCRKRRLASSLPLRRPSLREQGKSGTGKSGTQESRGQKVGKVGESRGQAMTFPTEVIPWFEVTDLEKARAFVNSPEVPDARQQSGVVDEPDTCFLSQT